MIGQPKFTAIVHHSLEYENGFERYETTLPLTGRETVAEIANHTKSTWDRIDILRAAPMLEARKDRQDANSPT